MRCVEPPRAPSIVQHPCSRYRTGNRLIVALAGHARATQAGADIAPPFVSTEVERELRRESAHLRRHDRLRRFSLFDVETAAVARRDHFGADADSDLSRP